MVFYVWDYLGYVRAMQTGYSEFKTKGRKVFGGEFPTCPQCKTRIGTLEWRAPFIVEMTTDKFGDLCTDGQDILLSAEFRAAWAASELSGLTFEDANVEIRNSDSITTSYKLARIAHTITRLGENASGVVSSNVLGCDRCRVMVRTKVDRIRVDIESWPGLDAFRPSGLYGATLVTSKFVDMVNEARLTNFHFVHQDDYREPKMFAGGI